MYNYGMSILAAPLCLILGHRRARRRVWNDGVDLRAPCIRCGASLIRRSDAGWRPFASSDHHPDRISHDAFREQFKREQELSEASGDQPEQWARQLVATLGNRDRPVHVDTTTLFDRLGAELEHDPAFVKAIDGGWLDPAARAAVGAVCARMIGAPGAMPARFRDPLASYLAARARATRAKTAPAEVG